MDVFFLEIHRLDPRTKFEYLLIRPVGYLMFVAPSIPGFGQAIVKVSRLKSIFFHLPFQRSIVSSDFWNSKSIETIKPAICRGNCFLHTFFTPIVSTHPFPFSQIYRKKRN